jgi:hypothetical protein
MSWNELLRLSSLTTVLAVFILAVAFVVVTLMALRSGKSSTSGVVRFACALAKSSRADAGSPGGSAGRSP